MGGKNRREEISAGGNNWREEICDRERKKGEG